MVRSWLDKFRHCPTDEKRRTEEVVGREKGASQLIFELGRFFAMPLGTGDP
jgi:hypothetical protein